MSQTRTYHKYTPDRVDESEFLARFVVRNEPFEQIISDIRTAKHDVPQQHAIIVGPRGQGKTTLLRKIQIEIKNDPGLFPMLIPVRFPEAQYHIRSLARVWEEVAAILQNDFPLIFPSILNTMEEHAGNGGYEDFYFEFLNTELRRVDKKAILLIDNIDLLLEKITEKEQRRLREILSTSSLCRIVGAATSMPAQHFNYGKPFFEFFKIVKLKGLTAEETWRFLRAMADGEEKRNIEMLLNKSPERVESLRRLTGGVPRTMVMLFDVFINNEGNAFDDLTKVVDEVTPLYKYRMDDLPVQQQDIVHTIAMNWDGIATKDIAKRTRLESKTVSAQLNRLEKSELIESESLGKNKIYKVKERFFNIWYLMHFGRNHDRQRVEWLVKFLESWCTLIDPPKTDAMNNVATLKNAKNFYNKGKNDATGYSYAGMLLASDHFLESYDKFIEWLGCEKAIEAEKKVIEYILLLFSKNQLYRSKKLFELPNYELKERYKPLWYALVSLLKDEMKDELAKMGNEMEESVAEILQKVEGYKQQYSPLSFGDNSKNEAD